MPSLTVARPSPKSKTSGRIAQAVAHIIDKGCSLAANNLDAAGGADQFERPPAMRLRPQVRTTAVQIQDANYAASVVVRFKRVVGLAPVVFLAVVQQVCNRDHRTVIQLDLKVAHELMVGNGMLDRFTQLFFGLVGVLFGKLDNLFGDEVFRCFFNLRLQLCAFCCLQRFQLVILQPVEVWDGCIAVEQVAGPSRVGDEQ